MRVLITGGCGFVGSSLAEKFIDAGATVALFDNLKRRGSEFNVSRLVAKGAEFIHGDIRVKEDLFAIEGNFDLFVEASAEPSVLAGLDGSPDYLLQTNLVGTLNCLEYARARAPRMVFLSTSRVYSIGPLRDIKLSEDTTRFQIDEQQGQAGVSSAGVAEGFAVDKPRSLYGASKLCSEYIIQEYTDTYNLKAVINRCGVIAGPGQFGKVDQGVFTMWVARHFLEKPLKYIGFGGTGKQVRDLLHPADLYEIIKNQADQLDSCTGETFNVGGGIDVSTSLIELTKACQEVTGNSVPIDQVPETTPVDIPLYVTDYSKAQKTFGWQPTRQVPVIVKDIYEWLKANESLTRTIF